MPRPKLNYNHHQHKTQWLTNLSALNQMPPPQLLQLQLPGGKRISATEFVRGHPGLVGQVLGR
jgi:hypothetical protein